MSGPEVLPQGVYETHGLTYDGIDHQVTAYRHYLSGTSERINLLLIDLYKIPGAYLAQPDIADRAVD